MTKNKYKHRPIPHPKTIRLKDKHNWKSPPGFKVVALDRAALSFNILEARYVAKTA